MWWYEDKEIKSHEDLHPECSHIIYEINYESGKKYLGYKTVRAMRRLKPTKAQLKIRKNYKRVEFKNIPFINYRGSSEETVGQVIKHIEILYQLKNKRTATYIETALLFEVNAIFSDEYLNKNIQGCYFDNALDGMIGELDDQSKT